jgi:DNA-binding TFAR19-related protein (PDSD5 family)
MEENEEEQYQRKMKKRINDAIKEAQQEEQKKLIMRQFLDSDAYARLMNIKASNYELYNQLVSLIVSLAQQNRVTGKITEPQLISILSKITYKKEPTIEFKHK